MPAARWRPEDFGLGLDGLLGCAKVLLGQLGGTPAAAGSSDCGAGWYAKAGRAGGARAQARGFGHRGGGHWGGGLGGSWAGWWPGPPAPPGPGRGAKAGRGDVRAAILALLRDGPRTGYQIMSDIEDRSGGAWRPSPGSVYPALSQLADEGLVVGEETGGRRTFSLTAAGRRYVEENPQAARGAWESQAQQEAWQLPGLFAEAARLGSGIVQIAHAGTPAQVEAAERLLEQTRRRLYQILAGDEAGDSGQNSQRDQAGAADQVQGGEKQI